MVTDCDHVSALHSLIADVFFPTTIRVLHARVVSGSREALGSIPVCENTYFTLFPDFRKRDFLRIFK